MGLTENGGASWDEVLAVGMRHPSGLDLLKYASLSAMSKEWLW